MEKLLKEVGYIPTSLEILIQGRLSLEDTQNENFKGLSALLLSGPPGSGKTFFAESLAKVWEAQILFYQCHSGTGKEELLFDLDIRGIVEKLSPHSSSPSEISSYLSPGILPQAIELSKEKKIVLILDELDKARPSVDGFLLNFLQNGKINIPHFGEFVANRQNLLVIATENRERFLSEPLIRRFRRLSFKFPKKEIERKIIFSSGVSLPEEKVDFIIALANHLRLSEGVLKVPSSPELIRACWDIEKLESAEERASALIYWLSPYEEDWQILFSKFPYKHIVGMLK